VEVFRRYALRYLRSRPDIFQDCEMPFLVRTLAPTPSGLPLEITCLPKPPNG
jgi:miniconductance mechanosensitive channel